MKTRSRNIILTAILVVAVSVTTTFITTKVIENRNDIYGDNSGFATQSNSIKARFASASSAFDTDFTLAADLSVHAVVHIKTMGRASRQSQGSFGDPLFDFFFGPQQRNQQDSSSDKLIPKGSGSGVIISKDGYIVTNNHVIDNAAEIEVTLNDKRTFKAKVIGTDPSTDIALLKVDGKDLPTISFGNSDEIKVGEWVLAVGNPFNLTSTVTAGIVSAKARNIGIIGTNRYGQNVERIPIESFIQTDAAINPGNSGGALVNTKGELIGINTAIASQTGSYAGYGFAVPTSLVKKVVTDLREHGVVQRALLGVEIRDITAQLAKEKKLNTLNGVLVTGLANEGAAKKAGIEKDDIIEKINGVDVNTSTELKEQVGKYSPGDKIEVELLRANKKVTVKVKLTNVEGTTDVITTNRYSADLGVQLKPINDTMKSALGIDYGLEVSSVEAGKFSTSGIKQSYIILKINNKEMKSTKDFENIYNQAVKDKKPLNIVGVYPTSGKIVYYKIDTK